MNQVVQCLIYYDALLCDDFDIFVLRPSIPISFNLCYQTSNRKKFSNVKLLSQSEVDNYKITDVVVPLPGSMVVYPNNMKDYYVKLLLEDELNLEVFSHKVK